MRLFDPKGLRRSGLIGIATAQLVGITIGSTYLGKYVDALFHTKPILTLVFVGCGLGLAIYNINKIAKKLFEKK